MSPREALSLAGSSFFRSPAPGWQKREWRKARNSKGRTKKVPQQGGWSGLVTETNSLPFASSTSTTSPAQTPCWGAAVLSRGIVGDRSGRATVQSPILKQAFALDDGCCLDDPRVSVPVYQVRVTSEGDIQVARIAA